MEEIREKLFCLRRRLGRHRFVQIFANVSLVVAAGCLAATAVGVLIGRMPSPVLLLSTWIVASVACSAAWVCFTRPSLPRLAALVDHLAATHDRFSSGLAFAARESDHSFRALALDDCRRFALQFNPSSVFPVRFPRRLAAVLAPLCAMALLFWNQNLASRPDPAALAAQKELNEKADALARLQKEVQTEAEKLKSPDLEKLAEAMRQTLEHLREAAQSPDASGKEALRELSSLESLIQQLQQQPPNDASAQLNQLADRMEKSPTAAESPEAAVRRAAEKLSQEAREQIEKALAEARQQGAEQAQLSEAMKRLAEALRRMAGASRPQGSPSRALKGVQMALQEMKFGVPNPRASKGSGSDAQNRVMMINPSPRPGDSSKQVMLNLPGGQPGSDRDEGTTENPFGGKQGEEEQRGPQEQLTGMLGEGESLNDLIPSAGDTSKSTKRYRDLYNAMAAESEDSVEQENIPLGSRFFIKRYFQNIRPEE